MAKNNFIPLVGGGTQMPASAEAVAADILRLDGAVSDLAEDVGTIENWDAGDIPYDSSENYNDGTVGGSLNDLKSQITYDKTSDIPCSFYPLTNKADVEVSGYSGKKVFISNRNLLPQFTAMTDHGVTCTKNSDGSISLSGTADGAAVISITGNEMPNLGAGVYALSCGNTVR